MLLDLSPNRGLLPLALGLPVEQARSLLGTWVPDVSRRPGEEAMRSADASIRLVCRDQRVIEIAASPPAIVVFDGIHLFEERHAWRQLVALEPQPKEIFGFLILKSIGVALSGLHDGDDSQRSVSIFEAGRWDELDRSMIPFQG